VPKKQQIKAALVPKHYTLTMDQNAMLNLILTLRVAENDLDVSPDVAELRAALENAYEGDLPDAPGEPIPYEGGQDDDGEAIA